MFFFSRFTNLAPLAHMLPGICISPPSPISEYQHQRANHATRLFDILLLLGLGLQNQVSVTSVLYNAIGSSTATY